MIDLRLLVPHFCLLVPGWFRDCAQIMPYYTTQDTADLWIWWMMGGHPWVRSECCQATT